MTDCLELTQQASNVGCWPAAGFAPCLTAAGAGHTELQVVYKRKMATQAAAGQQETTVLDVSGEGNYMMWRLS